MKKQIITVLLAITFLSANVFALSTQEKSEVLSSELGQQSIAQNEQAEDEAEKEEEKAADVEEAKSFEESFSREARKARRAARKAEHKARKAERQARKAAKYQEESFDPVEEMEKHVAHNQLNDQGKQDPWEIKRGELEDYVLDSYWVTWKMKSAGDVQMAIGLTTLVFDPVKIVATAFGVGASVDELEEFILAQIRDNKGKTIDPISKQHNPDKLYVAIQHNAFNLLLITKDDYYRVIAKYPEVELLFNDLYTFFKWRSQLHEYYKESAVPEDILKGYKKYSETQPISFYSYLLTHASEEDIINYWQAPNDYRYNDYFMYKMFRKATRRNSFEAWWELANIAKQEMTKALKQTNPGCLSTRTAYQEESHISKYSYNAHNALEAGRLWNGTQRYLVFHNAALPLRMNPVLGSGSKNIRKGLRRSMRGLSAEQLQQKFLDFRNKYIAGRSTDQNEIESSWQKTLSESAGLDSYKCGPADGQVADVKKRLDPIADDFTLADEIAQTFTKSVLKEFEK